MSYGINSPCGLVPVGHMISGVDNIKTNSTYTISSTSASLNKGDPVMYVPQGVVYASGIRQAEIMLYNPQVTINNADNATTIVPQNGVVGQPILGVFQGCEYISANGTLIQQEYWQAGTVTNGQPVKATIIDDPYVIYDIQLGTYAGASFADTTHFIVLPCLQVQNAAWPNTGINGANLTIANSCVIGSNVTLITGSSVWGVPGPGLSASLRTITANGVAQGYNDNPLMANQGRTGGNPWGVSTFYACPSIACTDANPSTNDGRNEYSRLPTVAGNLRVLGFSDDPRNVPASYGQPGNVATPGTYFNTPFLNVLVTINNHVNKIGTTGVTVA